MALQVWLPLDNSFKNLGVMQEGTTVSGGAYVNGKVTSATDGEPLIGATVQVQGSKAGSVTDIDGNYTINAEQGQTLVFSYVGYLTKTVKVGGASTIDVTLEEDRQSLEEVVVIGYGVQKKKLLTGATTQVKGENIAKLNTTNPLQAMQGQTWCEHPVDFWSAGIWYEGSDSWSRYRRKFRSPVSD